MSESDTIPAGDPFRTSGAEPEYVFLPGGDETNNDLLARFLEEFLAAGPCSWDEREEAMRWLTNVWLPPVPWRQGGTTCAWLLGGAMQAAQIQKRRKVNPKYAITTWLKVNGFAVDDPTTEYVEGSWIPESKLAADGGIIRGDILYWCGGNANTWQAATNGHVGCALVGEGDMWRTAEGGGGGGMCRMSDAPKDVSHSHARPRRGVWRPNLMPRTA